MSDIEEIAKTTGKAVDAAREAGGFLAPFIRRPIEQAAGIVGDWLTYVRWERQQRLIERANTFLKERGLAAPTRPVPLKIAIPIMREGSLEENDELQDIWVRLLVNSADADSGVEVKHMFLSILKDLTFQDARVLLVLYSVSETDAQAGLWTAPLPKRVILGKEIPTGVEEFPSSEVKLNLANLARLGLIASSTTWGGGSSFKQVYQTDLGREFVRACSNSPHRGDSSPL